MTSIRFPADDQILYFEHVAGIADDPTRYSTTMPDPGTSGRRGEWGSFGPVPIKLTHCPTARHPTAQDRSRNPPRRGGKNSSV
jgi:hypothetical protein